MADGKLTPADDAAGADGNDLSEFEAEFNKYAGDAGADTEAPPAGRDEGGEGKADESDKPDDADAGDADGGDKQADAEAEGAKPDAATADKPEGGETVEELLARADPRLRDYVQDLSHREASARGRISTLQRIQNLTDAQPKTPEEKKRTALKAAQLFESDDFKRAAEEYPEVVAPLQGVIKALADEVEGLGAVRETIEQRERAAAIAENERALEAVHPDWRDIGVEYRDGKAVPGKLNAKFVDWYQRQPDSAKRAIEANAAEVIDPDEAAYWIGRFKSDVGIATQGTDAARSTTETKRDMQLRSSQSARSRGGGAPTGVPDDFESAFEHFATKKAKAR